MSTSTIGSQQGSGLLSGLSIGALFRAMGFVREREISAAESASTLYRFFRSDHVVELRLIFTLGLFAAIGSFALFVLQVLAPLLHFDVLEKIMQPMSTTYAGPMLTVCGVVVAWAYRSASTRLGVVDLFACEISTLCRVGTILEVGKHYVRMYESERTGGAGIEGPCPLQGASMENVVAASSGPDTWRNASHHSSRQGYAFVSEEHYFPVFDNNARDLQLLEARVVSNIVEFYTYMKAARDSMRRLADASQSPAASRPAATGLEPDAWHVSITNVVYMLFLAYESGRKAVKDLVEFEPAVAERTMIILLTELRCYALLMKCFDHDDLRCQRLHLRKAGYAVLVDALCTSALAHGANDLDWGLARQTAPELRRRYQETVGAC